jgi:hypothetical protein
MRDILRALSFMAKCQYATVQLQPSAVIIVLQIGAFWRSPKPFSYHNDLDVVGDPCISQCFPGAINISETYGTVAPELSCTVVRIAKSSGALARKHTSHRSRQLNPCSLHFVASIISSHRPQATMVVVVTFILLLPIIRELRAAVQKQER